MPCQARSAAKKLFCRTVRSLESKCTCPGDLRTISPFSITLMRSSPEMRSYNRPQAWTASTARSAARSSCSFGKRNVRVAPRLFQKKAEFCKPLFAGEEVFKTGLVGVADREFEVRENLLAVRTERSETSFKLLKQLVLGICRGMASHEGAHVLETGQHPFQPVEKLRPLTRRFRTDCRQAVGIGRKRFEFSLEPRESLSEIIGLRMRIKRVKIPDEREVRGLRHESIQWEACGPVCSHRPVESGV